MGRFYKSARPQNVDYAAEFPLAALANAVNKKDEAIDLNYDAYEEVKASMAKQQAGVLKNKAQGSFLPGDAESYANEMNDYEAQMSEIAQSMVDDPMNTGGAMKQIRKVGSNLSNSMMYGNLAELNTNAAKVTTFLNQNKNKEQAVVKGIINSEVTGHKTINEDGSYNELTLPSEVYDGDIYDIATSSAKSVDPYAGTKVRAGIVAEDLSKDEDLMNTINQKLEFGMLKDADGTTIDPTNFTAAEKQAVIDAKLQELVDFGVGKTAKAYKPSSAKKTKGEELYIGDIPIKHEDGKGAMVKTTTSKIDNYAKNNGVSNYIATKNLMGANTEIINNEAMSDYNVTTAKFENAIYNNILNEVNTKVLPPNVTNEQAAEIENDYFKTLPQVRQPGNQDSWSTLTTKDEHAVISKSLNEFSKNTVAIDRLTIYSNDKKTNNKTIGGLKSDGTFHKLEDPATKKKNKEFVETLDNLIVNGKNVDVQYSVSKENGDPFTNITLEFDDYEDFMSKLAEENNELHEKIKTLEIYEGFDNPNKITITEPMNISDKENFNLDWSTAKPSQMADDNGNGRWAVVGDLNGEAQTFYFSDNDINIPAYNDVINRHEIGYTAEGKSYEKPSNKENNVAKRLFNEYKFSKTTEPVEIGGAVLKSDMNGEIILEFPGGSFTKDERLIRSHIAQFVKR